MMCEHRVPPVGLQCKDRQEKLPDLWLLRTDPKGHFCMNSSQQDIGTRFPEVQQQGRKTLCASHYLHALFAFD